MQPRSSSISPDARVYFTHDRDAFPTAVYKIDRDANDARNNALRSLADGGLGRPIGATVLVLQQRHSAHVCTLRFLNAYLAFKNLEYVPGRDISTL